MKTACDVVSLYIKVERRFGLKLRSIAEIPMRFRARAVRPRSCRARARAPDIDGSLVVTHAHARVRLRAMRPTAAQQRQASPLLHAYRSRLI